MLFHAAVVAMVAAAMLPVASTAANLAPLTRLSFGPDYRGVERCPQRCSVAGPHSGNWSLYRSIDQMDACPETLFLDFSLIDNVDDASTRHRIFACTSLGADWTNTMAGRARQVVTPRADNEFQFQSESQSEFKSESTEVVMSATPVIYQLGLDAQRGNGTDNSNDSTGVTLATADIRSMSRQLRSYLAGGFRPANESVILFARSGRGTLGVYMGRGLDNARTGRSALRVLEAALQQSNVSSSVAVQLCNDDPAAGGDRDYIFGVMAASDSRFGLVQTALQTWYKGSCMAADAFSGGVTNYSSDAVYLSPPPSVVTAGNTNSTIGNGTIKYDTSGNHTYTPAARHIAPRANCRTRDVVDGDSCDKLAVKCGISGPDFTRFNPDGELCSTLKAGMHVCCSEGTRPNYRPSRNADGTCAVHKIGHGETCTSLAAAFDVKIEEIERWNRRTWMFNGCNQYLAYQGLLCLSDGDPPMPESVQGAQCGPTMPGTPRQPASVDLNTVNPCPINACCDIWGSCGTSAEYCTDTHVTSAPGSAAPNTAGCISNCGVDLVQSAPPKQFLSVGYYEGYHFDRPCLYQDPTQIDTSKFTHLHYAFATIEAGNNNYTISTGDNAASYTFMEFRRLTGVKRIVSLGGWGFSTSPNTYDIFRQGVKPGNRETLAANVARFVTEHGLDGVDFDWEYPGAYDIPGIPPPFDGKDEGPNYLEFLRLVRTLLPDKSISIAVSSSYWYLRNFPIADMGRVVDYVVYMTYDLHGQWDAATKWSQPGCGDGKCLWSHVNLTETLSSLSMVTKAGVPSNKIVVGVSSYGRSFNMADGACWTETCKYTGTATESDAMPGVCTGVRGYIANAEIKQILADPRRVRTSYHDAGSDSNILVYDTNQWVSYMDSSVRAARTQRYRQLNMGGVANWAIDLEDYNDKPPSRNHGDDGDLGDSSWDGFILGIRVNGAKSASGDGYHGPRTGDWVDIQCDNEAVTKQSCKSGEQRWDMLDADHAWKDVLATWSTNRSASQRLSVHISDILNGAESSNCGALLNSNCNDIVRCYTGEKVGAAAYAVWNSLVEIHQMFDNYHTVLTGPVYHTVDTALKSFENAFAPVIPAENTAWVDILFAIVSLGATAAAAPFFNTIMGRLPFFSHNPNAADNVKDTTYALIASGAIISGTELKNAKGLTIWNEESQAQFHDYIGQALLAWDNATAYALESLMSGYDDSLDRLTRLVSHGKMLCGALDPTAKCREGNPEICPIDNSADAAAALTKNITRLIFASTLPDLWRASGLRPFVLDAGFPCNTVDPLPDYMSAATMHATYGCYQDRLYYLVMPKPNGQAVHCDQPLCNLGSCSPADCHHMPFVPPTGLDQLTPGNDWGDLARDDLIRGAVRTYQKNNRQNDDTPPDLSNRDTMMDLLGSDYTTPGVIRIPVCSADTAFKAWDLALSPLTTPHYPCAPPPLTASNCGESSFVDQTSNASPPVADCLQIVRNIEGTKGDYPVYSDQQGVLSAGLCVFGVQILRDKNDPKGPVMTRIANQDAVDLIRDAAARFGGSGRLGAKGTTKCGDYTIEWGLYHTK